MKFLCETSIGNKFLTYLTHRMSGNCRGNGTGIPGERQKSALRMLKKRIICLVVLNIANYKTVFEPLKPNVCAFVY